MVTVVDNVVVDVESGGGGRYDLEREKLRHCLPSAPPTLESNSFVNFNVSKFQGARGGSCERACIKIPIFSSGQVNSTGV